LLTNQLRKRSSQRALLTDRAHQDQADTAWPASMTPNARSPTVSGKRDATPRSARNERFEVVWSDKNAWL